MSFWDSLRTWVGVEPRASARKRRREGPPPEVDELREVLRAIVDPELGIDIVTLGLVRGLEIVDGEVRVDMTLTTQGCPVGPLLVAEVEELIEELGLTPRVTLGFEPPWKPEDIDRAAQNLG